MLNTLLLTLLTLQAGPLAAQSAALQLLRSAKTLSCSFDSGTTVFLNRYPPEPVRDSVPGPITFDGIDRSAGRAHMVATDTAGSVQVIAELDALTFVDAAPLGVSIYTVFARFAPGARPQELAAVVSTHISGIVPAAQLLYGKCRVLN